MSKKSETKQKKSAMEEASAYLASRMRTIAEMRTHLASKEYSADEIDEAVRELEELGYLDDYQYALRYYEYNREKKRGSFRAMRELSDKGVDEEIIMNSREDFLHEFKVDEFEDALALAERIVRDSGGTELSDKLSAKLARRLESAGYQRNDIIRVLGELRGADSYNGDISD